MATCTSCGNDVTGKKFCQQCGTPVQATSIPSTSSQPAPASNICPRCNGVVNPGAAFCNNCGSSMSVQAVAPTAMASQPLTRLCPACHTEVSANIAFCTNCGQSMNAAAAAPVAAAPASSFCTNCGNQNAPGVRFCASCGTQLGATATPMTPSGYNMPPGQYPPQQQQPYSTSYGQPQYQQQPQPYGQPQYAQQYPQQPQYGQPQYPQQYPPQQGQMGTGYQPQPMMGQQPMVLRCPVCQAMAPIGTANCVSCHTSLAGVVPTPENMPVQGQQGGLAGGLGGGQLAMGAMGGAAAVIGGEMLLHGLEGRDRNDGYGYGEHRHEGGLLGGLGELGNDIGLF